MATHFRTEPPEPLDHRFNLDGHLVVVYETVPHKTFRATQFQTNHTTPGWYWTHDVVFRTNNQVEYVPLARPSRVDNKYFPGIDTQPLAGLHSVTPEPAPGPSTSIPGPITIKVEHSLDHYPQPYDPVYRLPGHVVVVAEISPRELRAARFHEDTNPPEWRWSHNIREIPNTNDFVPEPLREYEETRVPDQYFTLPYPEETYLEPLLSDSEEEVAAMTSAVTNPFPASSVSAIPLRTTTSPDPDEEKGSASIAKPEMFDGDRTKVNSFLLDVMMNFDFKPKNFPTEKSRIVYTLSYMKKGSAKQWAETYGSNKYKEQLGKTGAAKEAVWGTCENFFDEVTKAFVLRNVEEDRKSVV